MKLFNLNFTTILGALLALVVIYFGGLKGVKNPEMFLDSHALILVLGGTLAATFLAFPLSQLMQLVDFIAFSVFYKKKSDPLAIIDELSEVNLNYKSLPQSLKFQKTSHVFLSEALDLISDPQYSLQDLSDILEDRVKAFKKKYQQDAKILNAIAKYPPAFGLLGATTGMIAMMTNLGGPGGTAAIGQSMAVALVATFWGIALANFFILPLSDNAQKAYAQDEFLRNLIREGILLIKSGTDQKIFIERLSSSLLIQDRYKARIAQFQKLQDLLKRNLNVTPIRKPIDLSLEIKSQEIKKKAK